MGVGGEVEFSTEIIPVISSERFLKRISESKLSTTKLPLLRMDAFICLALGDQNVAIATATRCSTVYFQTRRR